MWPPPTLETLRTSQQDNYGYSKMIKNASRMNRKENQLLVKQVRNMELLRDENLLMMDFTMRKISKPRPSSSPTLLESRSSTSTSKATSQSNTKKNSSLASATRLSKHSTTQKHTFRRRSTSLMTSLPTSQSSSLTSSSSTFDNTTKIPKFRRSMSMAIEGPQNSLFALPSKCDNAPTRPFRRSMSLAAEANSSVSSQTQTTAIQNQTRRRSLSSVSLLTISTATSRPKSYSFSSSSITGNNNPKNYTNDFAKNSSITTKTTKIKFGAHSQNIRNKKMVLNGLTNTNQDTVSHNTYRSMSLPYF